MGGLNFAGLPDDSDALISFDSRRPKKMSVTKIVIMPITTMAMIGSLANDLLAKAIAPEMTAIKPPSVTKTIAVAMATTDLLTSTGATVGSGVIRLFKLAPQRLQYFSSIVYSAPQLGQNIVREW